MNGGTIFKYVNGGMSRRESRMTISLHTSRKGEFQRCSNQLVEALAVVPSIAHPGLSRKAKEVPASALNFFFPMYMLHAFTSMTRAIGYK